MAGCAGVERLQKNDEISNDEGNSKHEIPKKLYYSRESAMPSSLGHLPMMLASLSPCGMRFPKVGMQRHDLHHMAANEWREARTEGKYDGISG